MKVENLTRAGKAPTVSIVRHGDAPVMPGKWVSVEHGMPAEPAACLVWVISADDEPLDQGVAMIAAREKGEWNIYETNFNSVHDRVTHWMLLPDAPVPQSPKECGK